MVCIIAEPFSSHGVWSSRIHAVHPIESDPKGAATTQSQIFMPKRPSPLPPEEPAEPQPGPDLPPVQEPPPEEPDVEPVKPVQDPLRDPVQPPPRMIISRERERREMSSASKRGRHT